METWIESEASTIQFESSNLHLFKPTLIRAPINREKFLLFSFGGELNINRTDAREQHLNIALRFFWVALNAKARSSALKSRSEMKSLSFQRKRFHS